MPIIIIWVLRRKRKNPVIDINKSEFYKNNDSYQGKGHPAYVFGQIKDNYIYLDMTHAKFVESVKNPGIYYRYKKLYQNPDKEDIEDSYISPFPYKANKKHFKNKVEWKFSEKDKIRIQNFKNKKIH